LSKTQLVILPVEVEVMECLATILEVTKLKFPQEVFQASVQVKCGDAVSKVFQITYKDSKELEYKLMMEVSKFKYALFLYGAKELRSRGLIT